MDPDRTDSEYESDADTTEATEPIALPKGVYFHKETGKYYMKFMRGGVRYASPLSMDMDFLVRWRVDKDKELDAEGVPATRVHKEQTPAERQSATAGVVWKSRCKKWEGKCVDRLASAAEGKTVYRHTSRFDDEAECAAALATLRAAEANALEAEVAKRKAADPLLDGLDRAPASCKDAQPGVVYWHVHKDTKYVPFRAIVIGGKKYERACAECAQKAFPNTPGGARTHCIQHGGGRRCPGPVGCTKCPYGISVNIGKADIYDGRCVSCFCGSFPNDPRAVTARSSVHAKERTVTSVLKERFPDYNWKLDKTFVHRPFVLGVNTRCRPDARFTQDDRVIIVEVDELSHRTYLCADEREREQSFVLQNSNKTVVMIRFNPDAYTDYSGKRIPSCFTPAEKGNETVHVHPKQQAQWKRRLGELESTISNLADPEFALPPKQEDRPLLICELFYDNVNATPEDKRVASGIARGKAIGKKKRKLGE
jgi:hypothetical protein